MEYVLIVVSAWLGYFFAERAGFRKITGLIIGLVFNLFGVVYLLVKSRSANKVSIAPRNPTNFAVSERRPQFSGDRFAQDGASGKLFSYASTRSGDELEADYVIVDLETSGLSPSSGRILEIALKRIDKNGKELDEYSTLVNPESEEVGATFIHHITPDAVKDAPTFEEIVDQIKFRMSGAIIVAHHAAFEDRFLAAEFKRAGIRVNSVPALDTLWLARTYLDLPNFKQETLIDFYGVDSSDAHTALGDVRALSKVLPKLLKLSDSLLYSNELWKEISEPEIFKAKTRVSNLRKGEAGWMHSIISKLPDHSLSVTSDVENLYLEYLRFAFQDGKIIGDEAKELARIAGQAGLGAKQVNELNQRFLNAVVNQAKEDGTVTSAEKKQIDQIRVSLGLN